MISCQYSNGNISRLASLTSAFLVISGCAALDPELFSDSRRMAVGAGTPVPVAGETQAVGTTRADAADDPEIWVDPRDPSRGVILGTDKQAGLYVYGFDGAVRAFIPDGRLNNVDLRGGFPTPQGERVLVAASDRGRMGAALYLLNPDTLELTPWGLVPLDLTEPYGLCMGRRAHTGDYVVIVNSTDGQVRQVRVSADTQGRVVTHEERRFGLATQVEGCVVDDARGRLYIGEEARGVWQFDLNAPDEGRLVAEAPSAMLVPDVEGLTLLHDGTESFLIASSQGDSAFAVWRADGPELAYLGRFSPAAANGVDGVTGTDGVAALGGQVGPFPAGLVVMQDDVDAEGEEASTRRARQNYKLVDWREVRRALGF
ncbi:phytase [Brevundimonas sp. 2R-24]|uniref:Phytase n=1 Tax=Peiella sedimenti TaxID=3061083 RepID=A0ABT8SP55_9CAUL|nr:phytase [Caulobacteraceae bacterium XZ-24]